MKLLRRNKASYVFQLSVQEREILCDTLNLYPLTPATHYRIARDKSAAPDENQRLLDEALAETRAENRRQVQALLNAPDRWQERGEHVHLKLPRAEIEWWLQVLNDIRVGCWLELGEPDGDKPPQLTPDSFRYVVTLEVCGAFESIFLAALGETESPEWAS